MGGDFFSLPASFLQTVSPYTVATNMTRDMSFGKNAEDFAREALDTLGLTSQTPGCLSHALQVPSRGNHGQRAGGNLPWLRSTSP